MTWIRRAPEKPRPHNCEKPYKPRRMIVTVNPDTNETDEFEDWGEPARPDGQEGDIWICDVCLTVWQIRRDMSWTSKVYYWRTAGWWVTWMSLRKYWKRREEEKHSVTRMEREHLEDGVSKMTEQIQAAHQLQGDLFGIMPQYETSCRAPAREKLAYDLTALGYRKVQDEKPFQNFDANPSPTEDVDMPKGRLRWDDEDTTSPEMPDMDFNMTGKDRVD